MPIAAALASLQANVQQCESLIANIHQQDSNGGFLLPEIDRKQVTVAAFLNFFIAWESFLEECFANFLTGAQTIGGTQPTKYAAPINVGKAKAMLVGQNKYFDYGNLEAFRVVTRIYFDQGYPFEPHINAMSQDIADMRTIRNASAHITSTTQNKLEVLAQRLIGSAQPGIDVYSLVLANDPTQANGSTIFSSYRDRVLIAAQAIAQG